MPSPPTANRPVPAAPPYRVAIAGTVTNAATGEAMPQATVRITAAPAAFAEGLMALLVAAIAQRPDLQSHYGSLIAGWPNALAPLATAQRVLDRLGHLLALARPDQTQSGGDGHYCFFDLPPGLYQLTATYTLPHYGEGVTSTQVEIVQSDRRLSFAVVNLALSLVPGACPLVVMGDRQWAQFLDNPDSGAISGAKAPEIAPEVAAHPRAETRSH